MGVNDSERTVELKHEANLLNHKIVVFDAQRESGVEFGADASWFFLLENPVDIEECTFAKRAMPQLTKMALARQIQLRDGLTAAERNALWPLPKPTLVRHLVNGEGGLDGGDGVGDGAGGGGAAGGPDGGGDGDGGGAAAKAMAKAKAKAKCVAAKPKAKPKAKAKVKAKAGSH